MAVQCTQAEVKFDPKRQQPQQSIRGPARSEEVAGNEMLSGLSPIPASGPENPTSPLNPSNNMPQDYTFRFYSSAGNMLLQMSMQCADHRAAMDVSERHLFAEAARCEIWEGNELLADKPSD